MTGGKESLSKPGPGNYSSTFEIKHNAPKYGFGSATRASMGDMKNYSPGPGNYESKNIIGTEGGQGRTMGAKLTDKTFEK